MKVFAPLIRHPSAICVAVVRIAMASEPASDSVMARQPIREPSQSAGRNLRFCSSVAWRTNRPFTRSAWWSKVAAEDMQTAPSSSPARQSSTSPSPAPPYCSGTHNPRMPSLAPSCHVSRGKRHSRSRSRALGATLSWAKSRSTSRSICCSDVRSMTSAVPASMRVSRRSGQSPAGGDVAACGVIFSRVSILADRSDGK